MTHDELEYSISQYLDGTLPPLERDALEERLAGDAEARALLGEYRALDRALKEELPVPQVRWDRLQAGIVSAVAQEEPPVRHYSMTWARYAAGVAAAACVLIAVTVAMLVSQEDRAPAGSVASIEVQGPQPEAGPTVIEVAVGPSPELQRGPADWRFAEGVVSRPSRVVIAGGDTALPDAARDRY